MNVLFVEPIVGKKPPKGDSVSDDRLRYPPLGLLKIGRYHINRGDSVQFVLGCDTTVFGNLLNPIFWDRIYISTLFTYNWNNVINAIEFYKKHVGGSTKRIYVGGIMATLMADDIANKTNIIPHCGIISSSSQLGFDDEVNIDELTPAYNLIDDSIFAIKDTYYAYTSRGCVNNCPWCGVPKIEPSYDPYIDIKKHINSLRDEFGDKYRLKLMDNNVLASQNLEQIVEDLEELGYGKNNEGCPSGVKTKKRVLDFNQGVDATYINKKSIELLSKLNLKPLRIAFDRIEGKEDYLGAVKLAKEHGFKAFSNYMLYNYKDTPKDLYERLAINIELNTDWRKVGGKEVAKVYSYPMRFAPIYAIKGEPVNRKRDYVKEVNIDESNWLINPKWTKKFIRNIEVMKSAANGAISPTPALAWRTIGKDFEEFVSNLYMPEELLRNRNKHERKLFHENTEKGTGKIEEFRSFLLRLIKNNNDEFKYFHEAVSTNSKVEIRKALEKCPHEKLKPWLELYLINDKGS